MGDDHLPDVGATVNALAALTTVEAVRRLEDALLDQPQVDLQTQHVIHAGMCARTIRIPGGTILTGALTKCDNICIVSGDITVTTEDGPRRYTGFHVLAAKAGAKRAGVAHADTDWTTVWPTQLTELQALEDEMTDEAPRLQTRRGLIGESSQ